MKSRSIELVVLFDGKDRLIEVDQFWFVAEQDLRAIRPHGLSILIAGPLSLIYGEGGQFKEYFDEVHYLPPEAAASETSSFLLEILRKRGADEPMREEQIRELCLASGGALRDLISLARNAGGNAYLEDCDNIGPAHVQRAMEQLGGCYLLSLGTNQRIILGNIMDGKAFSPLNSESMELPVGRRVLERSDSRYEVHPALAAVLHRASNHPE